MCEKKFQMVEHYSPVKYNLFKPVSFQFLKLFKDIFHWSDLRMIESLLNLHLEPQQSGFPVLWYHLAPVCLAVPGPSSVNTSVLLCGRGLRQNRPEAINTGNNFSVTSQFVTARLHHLEGTSVNFAFFEEIRKFWHALYSAQWWAMRKFYFQS